MVLKYLLGTIKLNRTTSCYISIVASRFIKGGEFSLLISSLLLVIQVILIGFTFSFFDSSKYIITILLEFLQYILLGFTFSWIIRSFNTSQVKKYFILLIPFLILASFRQIFKIWPIIRVLSTIIPRSFFDYILVDRVSEISILILGGIIYLIGKSLLSSSQKE